MAEFMDIPPNVRRRIYKVMGERHRDAKAAAGAAMMRAVGDAIRAEINANAFAFLDKFNSKVFSIFFDVVRHGRERFGCVDTTDAFLLLATELLAIRALNDYALGEAALRTLGESRGGVATERAIFSVDCPHTLSIMDRLRRFGIASNGRDEILDKTVNRFENYSPYTIAWVETLPGNVKECMAVPRYSSNCGLGVSLCHRYLYKHP